MPSYNLAEVAEIIRREQEAGARTLASLTRPPEQAKTYAPKDRWGMIEARGLELIKAHPDRDPKILEAGLDEIREWKDVPNHYPVIEDLERLGNGRVKRLEAQKETEYHPMGALKHSLWQGVKAVGAGLPAAIGRVIPGEDPAERIGRENKAFYDQVMNEDPDIKEYVQSVRKESEGFATEVLGSLGPTAAGLGMAFIPFAGPVLSTGMFYDLNTEEIETLAKGKGATQQEAERLGMVGGIINTALDMTGIGRMKKVFKPARKLTSFLVGLGLTSGIEGGTEGVQGVVSEIMSDWAAKPDDETLEAFIGRQLQRKDELLKTFAHDAKIGAAIGGGVHVVGAGVGGRRRDQGMAAGTGEVDAIAGKENESTPGKTVEKGPGPSGELPMAVAAGEVDAAARPGEPGESPEPQKLEPFLEVPPEAPLPEPKEAPKVAPEPTPDAESVPVSARVATVPTESLSVDPDRFQYKRGMGRGGAGGKLKKLEKYDPELGGILAVWRDPADGKTYVVNGHHRFELAQRTGHPDVAVHQLEAEDAAEARTKGALINIAEGQGTPEDAATIFRDAGITPERLETDYHISLKGEVAREGIALSRLEMGIFKQVERGDMPRKWGVVIGENLPDSASQRELVKYLDKQQKAGKRIGADTIGQVIEELKGAPRKEEEQMGLFGAEAFSRPLLRERAEIRAYVIRRLAEDKRLFGAVANTQKAERLEAEGNVLDVEKNLDIAEKSAIIKEAFEKLATYGGPVSDMLNRAAEDYANAGGKERIHVKQQFFDRIRKEIPTLVRQGFSVVSEGTPEYSGAGSSGPGAVRGKTGERQRGPFSLKPDTSASQLHLFAGSKERQGTLFEDVKDKIKFKQPKGKAAATIGSLRARQHTRMVSTGGSVRAKSLFVDDVHAAASLLRGIRRQRQENLYAVTTDKTGKILEIHRVSKGKVNEASAPMIPVVGRVFNIPGAHTVYLAHNHPSGDPIPSKADQRFTEYMRDTAALKDVRVKSIVLGENGWREIVPGRGHGPGNSIVRTPTNERIPIKEGIVVREKRWRGGTQLTGSAEAKRILKDRYGNADGFLLLDQKHRDMAFLPWPGGKSIKETAVDVIAALDATNANAIVINNSSKSPPAIDSPRGQFIRRLLRALHGEAQVLDVIDQGRSWADQGHLLHMKPADVRASLDAMKELNSVRVLKSMAGEKVGAGMYPEVVRKQVGEMEKGFPGFAGRLEVLPTVRDLGEGNLARAGIDPEKESIRGLHVTESDGNRRIYLFADALSSPRAVADTLMEEMFHDGIASALGEDSGSILDEIYATRESDVREAARLYDLDLDTVAGRREAADEWLAKGMVNDTLGSRLWQKIVAAVNGALRRAGIDLKYSVNEIKALARKAVTGRAEDRGMKKDEGKPLPDIRVRKSKAPIPGSVATLTGAGEEKRAAGATFRRHFREFWKPLSTIPEPDKALFARYKAMGTSARALRYIEKIHEKLDAFPDDVKLDLFRFMDGRIEEASLPMEARDLAKSLREKTTAIGKMLADRGIISQKTFHAHKGRYVHYMYAAHVLGDKAGGITTSTGKLNLTYAKQRKDLTPDERKALGLIEDASIAVPVGMGKALTDIAKYDYLETISENDKWVWTPSMVEIPRFPQREGKPETVRMGIGKLVEEADKYKEMTEKAPSDAVQQQYGILRSALEKAVEATKNAPEDFTQLPTSKPYGPLAGAYVRTPIAKDLMPVMDLYSDRGKVFEALARIEAEGMAMFKMGKVALNFPTAFRNVISNIMQNNMRGRPLAMIPGDVVAACRSMKARDKYYEEAFGHGIFRTNWFVTEINDVLDEFRKAEGGSYFKILGAIKKVARLYGKIDDISKHAIYVQMRKSGKTVDESVLEAMKWGMDYSLASRSVKHLRRHLVPFLSYQYKIAPLIAESLKKRPWVIGKFLAVPLSMEMVTRWTHDLDDDDWEDLEKQLPAYIKKSESMMILPWKTPEGQWQWMNAEYFFPWGNYLNLSRDVSEGDAGEIYKGLGISNPYLDIARMIASARRDRPPQHPFYGTPLYNQLDPAPVKAAKVVQFLAFTWVPSMLSPDKGALGYSIKAVEGDRDKWGKKVTPAQAAGRWFGVNIVSVSPAQTRAIASVNIQDLRKELYRIRNDPAKSDARKADAEKRYRERLAEIARTGASGAVLPIVKKKGKDPVYDTLIRMLGTGAGLPGPPGKTYYRAGMKFKMDNDQYDAYLERSSRLARPRLERFMTSRAWKRGSEAWKSDKIRAIVAGARKRARSEMKRRMGKPQVG